jgi:hypothetical protein
VGDRILEGAAARRRSLDDPGPLPPTRRDREVTDFPVARAASRTCWATRAKSRPMGTMRARVISAEGRGQTLIWTVSSRCSQKDRVLALAPGHVGDTGHAAPMLMSS